MAEPARPVTGYPVPNPNGQPPPPPTASYPYTATPMQQQQQYYYQAYYPDPYYVSGTSFLRSILCIMLSGVIITGMLFFISWLILRPQFPQFRINSLSVSDFNLSTSPSAVSGNFDLQISVRNPNTKISLTYENVQAAIFYSRSSLSQNALPPFTQPTENEVALQTKFSPMMSYVGGDVVGGINADRAKSGNVNLNVVIIARVLFRASGWWARNRFLKAVCGDLIVGIPANANNGTLVGGPRQCGVTDY